MKNKYERMADCFESAIDELLCDRADLPTKETMICLAIKRQKSSISITCRNLVSERIKPFASVRSWLSFQGFDTYEATFWQVQDYRKRWLESLAAEYRVKGLVLKHKNKRFKR